MDKPVRFAQSIQANTRTLQYVQDLTSLVYGTSAGILQFESLDGFVFFFVTNIVTSLLYLMFVVGGVTKAGQFYEGGVKSVVLDNFFRGLTAFLMTWTLFHALVQS